MEWDSDTPLLAALRNGHTDLARFLLDRGADPTVSSYVGDGLSDDAMGLVTVVRLAADHGVIHAELSVAIRLLSGEVHEDDEEWEDDETDSVSENAEISPKKRKKKHVNEDDGKRESGQQSLEKWLVKGNKLY